MNRPIDIRPPAQSTVPPVQDDSQLDPLRAMVAERRGRPLRIVEMPDAGGRARPPTMWLSSTAEDIVLINPEEPLEPRGHVLVQELAHLLFEEGGSTDWLNVAQLLPDLDPAVIERVIAG